MFVVFLYLSFWFINWAEVWHNSKRTILWPFPLISLSTPPCPPLPFYFNQDLHARISFPFTEGRWQAFKCLKNAGGSVSHRVCKSLSYGCKAKHFQATRLKLPFTGIINVTPPAVRMSSGGAGGVSPDGSLPLPTHSAFPHSRSSQRLTA